MNNIGTTKFVTHNPEETKLLAEKLLLTLRKTNVWLLQGELGAGKTTFVQGLLERVGAEGPFTSPTFVIIKKYELQPNMKRQTSRIQLSFDAVFHFDCYRVKERDILNLGWKEIINNPHHLVLVEWPERISNIWPSNYCLLNFRATGQSDRNIFYYCVSE